MQTLEVVGQVNELHQLSAAVPDSIRPGQVEIVIFIPAEHEDDDAAWERGIAHEWQTELNDSREDIYRLEDGGHF